MLGKLFSVFCLASFAFALASGNVDALTEAILENAQRAVTLTLALLGSMGLWCGVLNVFRAAGVTQKLAKLLAPILSRLFPDTWEKENGKEEICASVAANLLGIGNAATPLALCAMEKLAQNHGYGEVASDDMVTFTVMNTAPFSLLPTTLIALRQAADSQNPVVILPLVWICSFCTCAIALALARGGRRLWRQ